MKNTFPTAGHSNTERLQANSFGWLGQAFQSMAHMAPAIGLISTVPFMASRVGSGLPLAMAFAGVLALLLAYCLANLTKKFYGASGYFQIHSQALGSKVGFTTSWLFLIYEPINLFVTSFGFGILVLEPFSDAYLGMHIPWWVACLVATVVVTALALTNIKNSIRVTGVLAAIEIIIFVVLGVFLLHNSSAPIQLQYFTPATSATGWGGLLFAFVFGFLAFVGYESGLPLTEETKNTTSQTGKGLMLSVLFAAIFFTLLSYATVIGFGGGADTVTFAHNMSNAPNLYGILALQAFGAIGPWLLFFAALNSTFACCLAGANSSTRVIFSLGRANIFPTWLGQSTRRNKVPANAALTEAAITLVLTALGYFLSRGGNPFDWFGLAAEMLVLPLLIIHLVTCLSVFMAYRKTTDFHYFKHGILPLITGLLVLLPIWGAVYYNLQPPYSYAPWIVGIWFIIGLGVYFFMQSRHPGTLQKLENEMSLLRS